MTTTITAPALSAWQAVDLREYDANPADGCAEYSAHDAATGVYLGEVWHNSRGEWRAFRRADGAGFDPIHDGRSTNGTHASRGEVLAAIGWLDTVPACDVRDGAAIVLSDGTAARVASVGHAGSRAVLTLEIAGERVELADPRPVPGLTGTVAPDNGDGPRVITYDVRASADFRVTLAPPCGECDAPAGRACLPLCVTAR